MVVSGVHFAGVAMYSPN